MLQLPDTAFSLADELFSQVNDIIGELLLRLISCFVIFMFICSLALISYSFTLPFFSCIALSTIRSTASDLYNIAQLTPVRLFYSLINDLNGIKNSNLEYVKTPSLDSNTKALFNGLPAAITALRDIQMSVCSDLYSLFCFFIILFFHYFSFFFLYFIVSLFVSSSFFISVCSYIGYYKWNFKYNPF